MKQKQAKKHKQSGFTVVELLVVISMMVIIATVVIIDFNRQRSVRSMVLAKNETVTNLRKIQSYMLSSRNISEGVPAKFYIAKFELPSGKGGTSFTLQAVDNEYDFHDNLETITLPGGVTYKTLEIAASGKSDPTTHNCLQVIFSAPFGNMYARGAETCDSSIANILADPVQLSQISQRRAAIYIGTSTADGGQVILNPITGQISAN